MKWFQHECSAKHDPRLQVLGEEAGAEGIGVYWMLLEEIGQHSDSFHLKVTGISTESDQAYSDALQHGEGPFAFIRDGVDARIPGMGLRMLARILFTKEAKLLSVIEKSTKAGLFDELKWRKYTLLYSRTFEERATSYTRWRRRGTGGLRTPCGPSSDGVQRGSETGTDTVRTL